MIFCEYLSPIPGRACNWSLVAEFRSSRSVALDIAADLSGFTVLPCAAALPLTREMANKIAKRCVNKFLRIFFSSFVRGQAQGMETARGDYICSLVFPPAISALG